MEQATPITEADLHAYADGKVSAERRAEIEAWLAARPDDAERVAAYREAAALLRAHYDPILSEAVPERLERAASGRPQRRGPSWRAVALAAGWTVFGAALGALAAWQIAATRPLPLASVD